MFIGSKWLPVLAALLMYAPLNLYAQEADGPLFVQVRTTHVAPGKAEPYETFVRRLNEARAKAGWDIPTVVSQQRTGQGGYLSVSLYDRYADLGKSVRALFNDREWAQMTELLADSVSGGKVQTFYTRPELGRPLPIAPVDADAFVIIMVKVRQGGGPTYEAAMRKLVEASAKVAPELGWLAYSPDFSSANTYRFVIPQTWKGIDEPGMPIPERFTKAFGEEDGTRWFNQLNEPLESVDTFLTVNRQDLSYQPDQ